jgi:sugar phosphate isomerase/epimerase
MNALIGYSGFVGSSLIGKTGPTQFFNSKNIDTIRGGEFDTVYCCGVYAEKWKANASPEEDRCAIDSLLEPLSTVRCRTLVLISTVDVLDCQTSQSESTINPTYASHPYGKNRLFVETWARANFQNVHILRLPALFGPGLKKNALYDMMNRRRLDSLRDHWVFQWYNLDWLWSDIRYVRKWNIPLIHLISSPLRLGDIQALLFPEVVLPSEDEPRVAYDLDTDYPRHTRESVLSSMKEFVERKASHGLTVSQLAWTPDMDSVVNTFLSRLGIRELELVPSRTQWQNLATNANSAYSAQSLLYGETIQVFQEPQRFLEILVPKLDALAAVGTRVVVFGSPAQRVYSGEDAVALFQKVGDLCEARGILFCIENNGKEYGCNWLNRVDEALAFVKQVNHPHIRINVDTGSMMMEGETLQMRPDDITYVGHVQVSFPYLGTWDPNLSPDAIHTVSTLRELGYRRRVSLEMKPSTMAETLASIEAFVRAVSHQV